MKRFLNVVRRELATLGRYPIYLIFMVVMPVVAVLFFTTILSSAQPTDMPVGVVDMDDSPSTRRMARLLDAFQTSEVVAKYPSLSDARRAVQRGEIYAFLYVPEGTTAKLLSGRKPTISFYYSMTSMTSGSLLFRDLKTISSLGNAALMQATLRARGATEDQIMAYLQPITVDLHPVNNPTLDYNAYLSTTLVPGVLTLFMFLLTVYS
ncbi:MAG: ABC transporter permease, partial [Bacteroidaceae bacterium]|nr:ABC transporter permease [Bacteroidaceae bacterium]